MAREKHREPPYCQPEIAPDLRSGRLGLPQFEVHRAADLVVLREDRIDFRKSETDAWFEHVYRFAGYQILVRGCVLAARRYADTWNEVAIFFEELPQGAIPYEDEAFAVAAHYFFELADIDEVKAFTSTGYQLVDRRRLLPL